jgi:hypothetical protein
MAYFILGSVFNLNLGDIFLISYVSSDVKQVYTCRHKIYTIIFINSGLNIVHKAHASYTITTRFFVLLMQVTHIYPDKRAKPHSLTDTQNLPTRKSYSFEIKVNYLLRVLL